MDAGNDLDLGLIHGPSAPKRRRGRSFKRYYHPTGRRVGRPTNEEQALRYRINQESKKEARARAPKFGPPVPKGLGWGGARKGAGRPRREGPSKTKPATVCLDREFVDQLDSLPKGKKAEYLKAAINLMKDLRPPKEFLALGEEKGETDSVQSVT